MGSDNRQQNANFGHCRVPADYKGAELGAVDLIVEFSVRVDLPEIHPSSTYMDAVWNNFPSAAQFEARQGDARRNGKNLSRRRWIVGNFDNKSYRNAGFQPACFASILLAVFY